MVIFDRTKSQFDERIKFDIECRKWYYRQMRMDLIKEGVLKIAPSDSGFVHIYVHGFSCGCWNKKCDKQEDVVQLKNVVVNTIRFMRLGGMLYGKENSNV
jgi:hypothetical protein